MGSRQCRAARGSGRGRPSRSHPTARTDREAIYGGTRWDEALAGSAAQAIPASREREDSTQTAQSELAWPGSELIAHGASVPGSRARGTTSRGTTGLSVCPRDATTGGGGSETSGAAKDSLPSQDGRRACRLGRGSARQPVCLRGGSCSQPTSSAVSTAPGTDARWSGCNRRRWNCIAGPGVAHGRWGLWSASYQRVRGRGQWRPRCPPTPNIHRQMSGPIAQVNCNRAGSRWPGCELPASWQPNKVPSSHALVVSPRS